jgi:CheY-like chemotaxis protein
LAVVHGIVKSHEGAIVVRSTPGKGTAFDIYLPAAKIDAVDDRHARSQPRRDAGARILVIDDEAAIVRATTFQLERLGYRATGTASPQQALEWFESEPTGFDAVVMDLSMPGLSGAELAGKLLRMRPGLPIVMTSGRVTPEDAQRLRTLGIQEVVLKPSAIDELTAALARVLPGPSR